MLKLKAADCKMKRAVETLQDVDYVSVCSAVKQKMYPAAKNSHQIVYCLLESQVLSYILFALYINESITVRSAKRSIVYFETHF